MIKEIKDFPNYFISTEGDVYSKCIYSGNPKGLLRKLKPAKIPQGYLFVCLCKNKEQYNKRINRLVAEAFIPNPENKPEVNHKNGIKTDNRVSNLEWNSRSENMLHAYRTGLEKGTETTKHLRKPIYCVETNKRYESIRFAARQLGLAPQNISFAIKHKTKCGGFYWVMVD